MDAIVALGLAGAAAVNSAASGALQPDRKQPATMDGLRSGFRITLGVAASDVILLAITWATQGLTFGIAFQFFALRAAADASFVEVNRDYSVAVREPPIFCSHGD